MNKKLIFYIILIIVLLVLAFMSQQVISREIGKNFISNASDYMGAYLAKGSDWITSIIYPKISEEVQKRGDTIKNEIDQTKQKVTEDIPKKIENYFSGIKNSIINNKLYIC